MATKTNNAAANKVNAPANKGNKGNKANANNNAPAMDAATIAATAAAWLAKYASVRGIKDNGATLINEHGRDNFAAVLAACKATRAAEITNLHKDARGVLSFAAVLGREFDALKASAAWGRWCKLAAAEYADASAFVAACYPNVLSDGRPACRVYYTNGTTIYAAFRPLEYASDNGAAAVSVLIKALDNFKAAHKRAADKANDGGALVLNKVHDNGRAVTAYNVRQVTATDASGAEYAKIERDGRADVDAATLAKINVLSAGKAGAALPTLAEFNADLRA